MAAVFIATKIVIQLENQVQSPQWGAPLLLEGANLVLDADGKAVYAPAYIQRPMAGDEFDESTLQGLNSQLAKLGLEIRKVEVANVTPNSD